MLIKILYSYFTLANLIALANKIRSLLSSKFSDQQMINTVLNRMEADLEQAVQAIGSSTKQALTHTIQAADEKRDNSFRSLRDHVKSGLLRENDEYRTACEVLWALFEKNNLQLHRLGYGEETAAIDSLLNDLLKPENQLYLQAINITGWVDELNRDNQAFVAVSKKRSVSRSADDTVADEVAFKQLRVTLNLLENVLNTMSVMNDPENVHEVVAELNQYIRESNASAKQSKSHTATEKISE